MGGADPHQDTVAVMLLGKSLYPVMELHNLLQQNRLVVLPEQPENGAGIVYNGHPGHLFQLRRQRLHQLQADGILIHIALGLALVPQVQHHHRGGKVFAAPQMQPLKVLAPLVLGAHLPANQAQFKQLKQLLLLLVHHRFQYLSVIFHIREPACQKLQFVSVDLLLYLGHPLHQPAHRSVDRI